MPGEGSILGMIISLKNNRNLLKQRRKPFNKDKFREKEIPHIDLKFKQVSESKLKEIKSKIRYRAQRERQLYTIVFISLILIFAGIVLYFLDKNIL